MNIYKKTVLGQQKKYSDEETIKQKKYFGMFSLIFQTICNTLSV